MKAKISEKIIEKYPEVEIGVLVCKNLDNSNYPEEIQTLIKEAIEQKRNEIAPEKTLEIPSIAKWREVYKSFGAKPSNTRNSAEALIRRILKDNLYKINTLVDLYNLISIKYIMTVGGEDIDSMEGDLLLAFADGTEEFIPLGSEDNKPPKKGEVVYKDDKGVICRCWNWREGDRTKLEKTTKNAIVVIENMIPEDSKKHQQALEELKALIQKYCNAEIESHILNKDNLEATF